MTCIGITPLIAQRYYTEVFSSTTVTSDVVYGQNFQVYLPTNPGPILIDLKADVYEPVGDTLSARPTVILLHTGSFVPIFYNGQPTGIKTDSAVTEMCRQFARRGFTAIAMDYRLWWNPVAPDVDVRKGTILQAVGRAIQDAKACVRYFRNNANTTNTYHIDETKISLGGMGTGGYIALGYATIDKYSEIGLFKFLPSTSYPTYCLTGGVTPFDSTCWGSIDGYGGNPGLNNSNNTPGVSNDICFVFNMGGALGDSSWLEPGDVPMVCFHTMNDPFAPYTDGPVFTPPPSSQYVVDVSGSYTVIKKGDALQNNSAFQYNTWTDPFTTRANTLNNGYDGLFPFELPPPPNPPSLVSGQAGPWEWWDSTTVYYICTNFIGFTQGHTDTILTQALWANPDMSSAKGHAYIDTTMNYLLPRLIASSCTPLSINEISPLAKSVSVYPNPATNKFTINITDTKVGAPQFIEINDATGRMMKRIDNPVGNKIVVDRNGLEAGAYLVKVKFNKGEVVKKIILQ